MNRKKLIAVACLLSLGVLWFVAVDWSWFVHDCPDCGYGKDVAQYRIFTVPVYETVYEFPSITQQVAADLGVPCRHENSESWHKHRWWGLCLCKSPCINGIYRLTGDDSWYNQDVSTNVAALARNDPTIKAEFVHRVLEQHEFEFVQKVFDKAGIDRSSGEERITK